MVTRQVSPCLSVSASLRETEVAFLGWLRESVVVTLWVNPVCREPVRSWSGL